MTALARSRARGGAYGVVAYLKDYPHTGEIEAGHSPDSVVTADELSIQVFDAAFARRLAEAFTQAARMCQAAGR